MTEEKPIWEEEPEFSGYGVDQVEKYLNEVDAFHEKLKGKITQIHECLGEYQSKEWCGHCIVDSKCAQITMHIIELKKKAECHKYRKGLEAIRQAFIKSFGEDSIEREDFKAGDYGANDSIDLANTIWKILEDAED